jgi:putative transposase
MVDSTRPRCESQARATANARDGLGGDLSAAANQRAVSRTPNLPVFILLRNLAIERPNQVWSADITYVPLRRGFMYLVAVLDWHSRYVLSWELSNTLDSSFCVAALEAALARQQPEIFNTDQGAQFTSQAFTGLLEAIGIAISMDGRGRALDNVFIERLWRTVKYENIYLQSYETAVELECGLASYFDFYCYERLHMALEYRTPWEAYSEGRRLRRAK